MFPASIDMKGDPLKSPSKFRAWKLLYTISSSRSLKVLPPQAHWALSYILLWKMLNSRKGPWESPKPGAAKHFIIQGAYWHTYLLAPPHWRWTLKPHRHVESWCKPACWTISWSWCSVICWGSSQCQSGSYKSMDQWMLVDHRWFPAFFVLLMRFPH